MPGVVHDEADVGTGGSPYDYELAGRPPLFEGRFGAAHAVEIGLVFDNLRREGTMGLTGDEPPQALADVMHRAWVAFATNGTPGWPPYDSSARSVMRFNGVGGTVVMDLAANERRLWDGVR